MGSRHHGSRQSALHVCTASTIDPSVAQLAAQTIAHVAGQRDDIDVAIGGKTLGSRTACAALDSQDAGTIRVCGRHGHHLEAMLDEPSLNKICDRAFASARFGRQCRICRRNAHELLSEKHDLFVRSHCPTFATRRPRGGVIDSQNGDGCSFSGGQCESQGLIIMYFNGLLCGGRGNKRTAATVDREAGRVTMTAF